MTKKLHILFLCGWYPSQVLPNNGDFIQRHAEAVSLLHNVSVLHIISDENATKNIEITSEEINGVKTYIGYVKKTANPVLKVILFYKAYKKIIQKTGSFDLIHLNELFPFGLFTFLQKKPFIVSEHWTGYHYPQSKNITFWQRFLSKKMVKKARFICPVSNELATSMKKIGLQGIYQVVPNVVDTDVFFPLVTKPNQTFTILHISSMNDAQKNVSGIIRAVSKLSFDYKLILIGKNSAKFKPLSNKLNNTQKIDFIEHLPHQEIPKYLQKADVYISFSNYETWGIVMMEALACGTPVISTKTGILHELNATKHAKIINTGNENALIEAINTIKKNSAIDKKAMHNFIFDNFSPLEIAKQFTKLYEQSLP